MIHMISDFHDPALDIFARLNENQLKHYFEPEEGIFLAETSEVILRALELGYDPLCLLLEEGKDQTSFQTLIRRVPNIPIYEADYEVLKELTGFPLTRGALCAMRRKPLIQPEDLLENCRRVVVLEEVMNPTNVGAIFRSAAALGMDGVLLTKGYSDPLYRRSIRVSMGGVFQIPWTFMETEKTDLPLLHSLGFTTVAMALRKETTRIDDPKLKETEKIAVLLGSEKTGLLEETIGNCQRTVKIPMAHGVDSLNVAGASAIAFWELGIHE